MGIAGLHPLGLLFFFLGKGGLGELGILQGPDEILLREASTRLQIGIQLNCKISRIHRYAITKQKVFFDRTPLLILSILNAKPIRVWRNVMMYLFVRCLLDDVFPLLNCFRLIVLVGSPEQRLQQLSEAVAQLEARSA